MKRFWNFIKNNAKPEEIDLRIDGEIVEDDEAWFYEWFGIPATTPSAFREALADYKGKNINVWIDSWGGGVFAGVGVYNALKEHDGRVIVKVDGKAVSAASIVAMAGEEILMSPGSIIMIHNPWSRVAGEAKDMRHTAEVLDEVKDALINIYQLRTGRSRKKISEMMDNETWMSAKTAMAEGFSDGMLYVEKKNDEPVENAFMLSGLAIQNSVNEAMKKFFEMLKKQAQAGRDEPPADPPGDPPDEPKNNQVPPESNPLQSSKRVFDIKKRVSVREKSNRRTRACMKNFKNC